MEMAFLNVNKNGKAKEGGEKLNVPAKASLFSAASSIISKAAAFLFTPFFTRLMPPEEYGRYSLFFSYLSALLIFSTLEITGSVYFKASQRFGTERRGLERKALLLMLFSATLTFIAFLTVSKSLGIKEPFPSAYPLLFLSVISSMAINLKIAGCKYSYKYKTPFFITLHQSILTPAVTLTVLKLFIKNESALVFAKVATGVMMSLAIAIPIILNILFKGGRWVSKKREAKGAIPYLLKLSLPMLPYYISLLVISSFDRIIIGNLLGAAELGKYAVGYSAGIAISGVVSAATGTLLPWITRRIAASDFPKIVRLTLSAQKVIITVSLAFMAVAPEIIKLLAPSSYGGALATVYPAAASALPIFFISVHVCGLVCYEKSFLAGILGAVCAAVNLLLNIFLIKKYGITAAAVITLLSYLLLFAALTLIFCLITKKRLISLPKSLRNTLLFITLACVLYLWRDFPLPRYAAAGIFSLLPLWELYQSKSLLREADAGGAK